MNQNMKELETRVNGFLVDHERSQTKFKEIVEEITRSEDSFSKTEVLAILTLVHEKNNLIDELLGICLILSKIIGGQKIEALCNSDGAISNGRNNWDH